MASFHEEFMVPNSKTIPHRASAACIMALETPKALSLATCELISGKLWPCLPQVSPQFVDVQKENQSNQHIKINHETLELLFPVGDMTPFNAMFRNFCNCFQDGCPSISGGKTHPIPNYFSEGWSTKSPADCSCYDFVFFQNITCVLQVPLQPLATKIETWDAKAMILEAYETGTL